MNRTGRRQYSGVSRFSPLALLFFSATCGLMAAPAITSVANAASNIGFNSPIAQGAVFVIKGSGLGPATPSIATAPFQNTTVDGTSVAVTAGGTTVNALMYYTSDGQVAALLPSNTPTGVGTFTVTYNGQTSNPVNHGIATNNFGLLTLDSSGQGPAIVTYGSDYSLVSALRAANCGGPNTACGAANPGDTLVLWGTGLGPVNGSDASGAGLGQNMPNIPLTVFVGGVPAQVLYQGRSGCCVGLDQIAIVVPAAAPVGCAVPLVVQIGTTTNTVSNTTVLPVANGARDCTPTNTALDSLSQVVPGVPFFFGDIDLERDPTGTGTGYEDSAYFQFLKATVKPGMEPFLGSFADQIPAGTCIVFGNLHPDTNLPLASIASLDGGPSIILKASAGSTTVIGSSANLTTFDPKGAFLVPGTVTVTGTGGADVGGFSATITIPAPPALVSPVGPTTVTRATGTTVTWNGGDPGANLLLWMYSSIDNTNTIGSTAQCKVSASARTFTIPPYVQLALPAGSFGTFLFGTAESESAFTAPGLNGGSLHTQSVISGFPVTFK